MSIIPKKESVPSKEIQTKSIDAVSQSLKELYHRYSSEGMLAVYIWGSVLTPDFNPESSDIDTIAIVDDKIDLGFEKEMQEKLALEHPEIKRFGFRLLYKSELDTGVAKGALATVGDPALLLLDLPTWSWVCGNTFTQKDFSLAVPTYDEAIRLRYESAEKRWPDIELIKPEEVQYFVKQILRIIHLKQLVREKTSYTMFSYRLVGEKERGMPDENVVDICLKIKKCGWDFGEFREHRDVLKKYLSDSSPKNL